MKKRFSVKQIVAVLKQAELGVPLEQVKYKVAPRSIVVLTRPRRNRGTARNGSAALRHGATALQKPFKRV